MKNNHNLQVNLTREHGENEPMLQGHNLNLRSRVLQKLFGTDVGIIVLNPGPGINEVIIKNVEE